MKIFTKKNTTQKIILAILIVTLCNFIFPTYSRAGIGGILVDPIVELVTSFGDTVLSILQSYLYNGRLDVEVGLGSILAGASYFEKEIQGKEYEGFKDMTFSDPESIAITIDSDNFDKFDVESLIPFLVSPVAGIISVVYSALSDSWMVPIVQYSADKIFAGKIPAFDINFINPDDYDGDEDKQKVSIAYSIKDVIAEWYVSLRNFAIVMLLCILAYTGIKIVMSSSADDRAKYKQRLFDWIVAMCLVFCMHYIMAFILEMIDILNNTIGSSISSIPVIITKGNDEIKFNTDLMGLIRLQVQYKDFTPKIIYTIFYIGLLVYTCKFTWVYLKRTVTMAFLTIIAPLVAMTYPIDKMNDGKAQAFNAWLKEYIFTALLQPFHLIVYSVLVGSSIEIAINNPLYGILVIAFMGPAEKMLRKFFGFDKASTPGMLSQAGAMFGGAAAMNMFKKGAGYLIDKRAGGGKSTSSVRTRGGNSIEDQNAPGTIGDLADRLRTTDNVEEQNGNGQTTLDEGNSLGRGVQTIDNENPIISSNNNAYDLNNEGSTVLTNNNSPILRGRGTTTLTGVNTVNSGVGSPNRTNVTSGDINVASNGIRMARTDDGSPENSSINANETQFTRMKNNLGKTAVGRGVTGVAKKYKGITNANKEHLKELANRNMNLKDPRVRQKIGKNALKLAGKAAVAGTMGAIGVGIGAAGEDLEDVLKYGVAGGALGYATSSGIGRRIVDSGVGQSVKEGYGRATYGSDNAAQSAWEKQRQFETGEKLEEAKTYMDSNGNYLSGKELAEMESRLIEHDVAGLSSTSDRKKAIKLEDKARKDLYKNLPPEGSENYDEELQKANDLARAKSQVAVKVASAIEAKKLNTAKGQDEIRSLFKKEFANKGIKGDVLNKESENMLDLVLSYHKKPKM